MPAEIYNTNPTIFATNPGRQSRQNAYSLWIDEDKNDSDANENEVDEPIDSDEIFGRSI